MKEYVCMYVCRCYLTICMHKIACRKGYFLKIRTIFLSVVRLSAVYNMASSGLWKMLTYIIYKHQNGVWENVFLNDIDTFLVLLFWQMLLPRGRWYPLLFWQMLLPMNVADIFPLQCIATLIGSC